MPAETQIIITAKDLASDVFVNVGRNVDGLKHKLELAEKYIPFLGVSAAAYMSGEALKEMFEHTVDNMDVMGKLAEQTGMTVEEISSFSYVARMADVSLETFAKSVEKLERNMVSASGGVSEGMDSMAAGGNKVRASLLSMGFSQKDILDGLKDVPGFLSKIAGKFEGYENGATKTALAMNLFGKSGAAMIPALNKGADGFRELFAEAKAAGNVLSEETAKQAEEVVDSFKRMHSRIDGAKTLIATGLLPTMKDLTDVFMGGKGEVAEYSNAIEIMDALLRGAANSALFLKAAVITSAQGYLMLKDAFNGAPNVREEVARREKIIEEEWKSYANNAERLRDGFGKHGGGENSGHDGRSTHKPQAPIPDTDGGKGLDTLKTLTQEAMKAEEAFSGVKDSYNELWYTLRGDTESAAALKSTDEYFKQQMEAARELKKVEDERASLKKKGKLTPQAAEVLDRHEEAVRARMLWQPYVQEGKNAVLEIQQTIDQMTQKVAHSTAMAGFTGIGVYEAQVKAINAKYDALRQDPKTMQYSADWDAEQQAALARARQDHAKAIAGQRAELAQLTGNTREYYLAQADVLAIDVQLAQTDAERALKAEQYSRAMAQANGDWINASKMALAEYKSSADDTWKQVHDTVGSCATDMENYMVDSAMGTKNAWANALTSIERDFIRMLTRMGPMSKAMGMAGGFISTGMESLFGYTPLASEGYSAAQTDAAVSALEANILGGRASGGEVSPGRWLVGENGPEVLDVGGPGYVFNNSQTQAMLSGASGGSTVNNVSFNQHFDFRGADTGVETRIRGMLGAMKQQTKREMLAELQALNNRGGQVAKNFGRRQ
jgi:hypothetical protein